MPGRVHPRLLPGAPRWLVGLVALIALSTALLAAVDPAVPGGNGPDLRVVLPMVLVLHAFLLALLWWRVRRVATERPVWNRLALGAAIYLACVAATAVLQFLPVPRAVVLAPLYWSSALVFPVCYSALVRWNRHSTSTAGLNDSLNGISAVLAIVAVLNVALNRPGTELAELPWWELQAVFAQLGVGLVVLGTALTLPSISGMGRDARTWLMAAAQVLWVASAIGTLLAGGQAAGWGPVAHPLVILCLAVAAVLRSRRSAPRPADAGATTIGAFVVIMAATGTLAVAALTDAAPLAVWCAGFAAVGAGLRLAVNVRELAQLTATRREALTDELTGLGNRRALLRHVEELTAEGTSVALALLDVDKFKEVNDALGHSAGDELLGMVARRLEPVLRAGDLLCRLGGDEFAVVAALQPHDPPAEAALALGTRLHARMTAPFPVEGMDVHVSASIGVTTTGCDAAGSAQLLRRADVAMYDAKRSGVGVVRYDGDRHADSSGHLALVEELRRALPAGQLVLHHQPQVDVRTGRVHGVEALVRWAHPDRGLLGPAEFLPLAEVHGLMGALTATVLAQAVEQLAVWRSRGLELRMSVNLSASNLLDAGLPSRIRALLDEHDVPAPALVLEVTETVLLTDPERSLAVIAALTDLGATVSIDDFGTGYSSLAYLRDLPVAELKLDRSFTADLLTDDRTEAIVASTVALAHRLGLHVVAEGVEQEATLRHLEHLGCDTSQGYLHSRPVPAAALESWLTGLGSPVR